MTYKPKPGHYLHASCSYEDVYEIIGSGVDDNGVSVLDLRVIDPNGVVHFDARDEFSPTGGSENYPLTRVELPEGVSMILRDVQWHQESNGHEGAVWIVVNGPKGGCYRCCHFFGVYEKPDAESPVRDEG